MGRGWRRKGKEEDNGEGREGKRGEEQKERKGEGRGKKRNGEGMEEVDGGKKGKGTCETAANSCSAHISTTISTLSESAYVMLKVSCPSRRGMNSKMERKFLRCVSLDVEAE